MNVNRLIAILIVSLIGLTAYGLSTGNALLISLGHIGILPSVGIWYGFKRQWQTASTDIAMYTAYFVGSFSDSFVLIGGQIGETLQIVMTIIMHTFFIYIFRKEGTRIYSDKQKDLPKLLIPITIIFIFFGTVLMAILPEVIYFLTIFYCIQLMILVSHGLFRQVKGRSYIWVATGVVLMMVKDILYSYNFFVYQNSILPLYIIQYSLSAIVYFILAVGISFNQTNESVTEQESVWQFIKNHIKLLFTFNNLTHFNKAIFTETQIPVSQNLLSKTQGN
jgi:hypothetical protein